MNRALDGEDVTPASPAAGGTDYAQYLLIDDLLRLQRPLTPGAHDELLFIVVHQAYELWFKLILHELAAARDALGAGRPHVVAPHLRRVLAIERLLLDQLAVLETMGPEGFLEFRDPLTPASGFQSRQFREIEWISGERGTWPGGGEPPAGPSLYEAFCAGLELPEDRDDAARGARRALQGPRGRSAARRAGTTSPSCCSTTTSDSRCWRHHHTLMAAREIGTRQGTGGSPGVDTCGARSTDASSRSSGTSGWPSDTARDDFEVVLAFGCDQAAAALLGKTTSWSDWEPILVDEFEPISASSASPTRSCTSRQPVRPGSTGRISGSARRRAGRNRGGSARARITPPFEPATSLPTYDMMSRSWHGRS